VLWLPMSFVSELIVAGRGFGRGGGGVIGATNDGDEGAGSEAGENEVFHIVSLELAESKPSGQSAKKVQFLRGRLSL